MKSMTGYGKAAHSDEKIELVVEFRTLNNRNFDMYIGCPQEFRSLEMDIRNTVKKYVSRGRTDCYVTLKNLTDEGKHLKIDRGLLREFFEDVEGLKVDFNFKSDVNLEHILRIPDVIKVEKDTSDVPDWLKKTVLKVTVDALKALDKMRSKEGKEIQKNLSGHVDNIEKNLRKIIDEQPQVQNTLFARLRNNIEQLIKDKGIDEARIAQEAGLVAEKADVTEELERMETHIEAFRSALKEKGVIGKKLDFILQEMGREANTLCSKTAGHDVNRMGIEMKLDIEKLREQVQNIE